VRGSVAPVIWPKLAFPTCMAWVEMVV